VDLYWNNTHTVLGQFFPDVHGTLTAVSFAVPKDATPGVNTILANGPISGVYAQASFTVR
jgi:hypothetical protein